MLITFDNDTNNALFAVIKRATITAHLAN